MNKLLYILLFIPIALFGQCEENELTISILTTTGNWGNEMCWSIFDEQTYIDGSDNENSIATYCGLDNYQTTLIETCISDTGCFIITATDDWGDGWNGGTIEISINSGDSELYELSTGSYGYWFFELNTEPCIWEIYGCTDINAINYNTLATIDDGSCILPFFFNWDNEQREYWLYIPENLPENAPLVFTLHGYGGTGGSFYGFEAIAEEHGFIICSPTGLLDNYGSPHWNSNFSSDMTTVDDVGFLSSLAIFLQYEHSLDPNKTFACGMSNGGYMSWTLACNAPDVFKAIASVTGTMSGNDWEECNPSPLIPVMQISGTYDNVVPINGYPESEIGYDEWGGAPDIYTIFDFWANMEECTNYNTGTILFDYLTDTRFYSNCVNNNQLRLYIANGMGHTWPGFASEEIWNFFNQSGNNSFNISENTDNIKTKIKTLDVLGREINNKSFTPLIDLYDDGSSQKRIMID